jgi:hypothetical protein
VYPFDDFVQFCVFLVKFEGCVGCYCAVWDTHFEFDSILVFLNLFCGKLNWVVSLFHGYLMLFSCVGR